jgi:hypothetical protein
MHDASSTHDATETLLFSADADSQGGGLASIASPIEGHLCAAVLALALFSEHPKVRADARALLLARGPEALRAQLEGDKRNYAALQDGAKLAKLATEHAGSVDPHAFTMAMLHVFSARAAVAPAWAGAAIAGALHAALVHASGAEGDVFAAVANVERLELTIKKELPRGLGRLRGVKWLRISGAIKSAANVAELTELPQPIGLHLTGKDLDLAVLVPAAANVSGLAFHGNATKLTDVSILAHFPRLETLWLTGTGVTDLGPLSGLPLVELTLGDVSSLEPLRGKSTLRRLTAERARCDLAPIATLTELRSLNVSFSLIDSAAWLAPLGRLEHVDLTGTRVRDLSPLAGKPLVRLLAEAPASLAPLFDATTLEELVLRGSPDPAELEELTKRNPRLQVTIR